MHRTRTKVRARTVTAITGLAAMAVSALTACQPPAPDGRDLGVTTIGAPTALTTGQETAFTIRVTNHGTTTTTATSATLLAPGDLQPTAAGPAGACPAVATPDGHTFVACPLGALGAGQTRDLTVTLTGRSPATAADLIVEATSDGTEPAADRHPNRTVLPVEVRTPGEVDLVLYALEGPAPTGGTDFISVAYVNTVGSRSASSATVTQQFPTDVAVLEATFANTDRTEAGTCTTTPGLVSCTSDGRPVGGDGGAWDMWVTLAPDPDRVLPIAMEVVSPQAEPLPDSENPNTALQAHHPASTPGFDTWPQPRSVVGSDVVVRFGSGIPAVEHLDAIIPAGFELRAVGTGGSTIPCVGTGAVSCSLPPGIVGQLHLRATAPTAPAPADLSFTTASGVVSGPVYLWAGAAS